MQTESAGDVVSDRLVVQRAPGGFLIEVAGHQYFAYRSCPIGCHPDPEDVFLAGLVTSAALKLEILLRARGAAVHDLRLGARVGRTPDGRRRVTLEPRFPDDLRIDEHDEIRRELVLVCSSFAIARSDMELDVEEGPSADANTVRRSAGSREEAKVS